MLEGKNIVSRRPTSTYMHVTPFMIHWLLVYYGTSLVGTE